MTSTKLPVDQTDGDQSRCYLFLLPIELRLEIYEHVLGLSTFGRIEVSIDNDRHALSDPDFLGFHCSKRPHFRPSLDIL